MLETVYRSDEEPFGQRAARFVDAIGADPRPAISGDHESFRATLHGADLPGLEIAHLATSTGALGRSEWIVRAGDPEDWAAWFLLGGSGSTTQAGHVAEMAVDDFGIYDNADALTFKYGQMEPGTMLHLARVRVPRTFVPLPKPKLARITATKVSGRRGPGSLLTQLVRALVSDPATYTAADVARIGIVVADLMTAALAHHLEAASRIPDASRRDGLLPEIQAYALTHLGDPDLSPRSLAAVHHISVSYLHRLFEPSGVTAAAWIRRQRLGRARRDLTDPTMADLPVHRIAARWGFADHATFTRAFHAAFGAPPQAFREHELSRLVANLAPDEGAVVVPRPRPAGR